MLSLNLATKMTTIMRRTHFRYSQWRSDGLKLRKTSFIVRKKNRRYWNLPGIGLCRIKPIWNTTRRLKCFISTSSHLTIFTLRAQCHGPVEHSHLRLCWKANRESLFNNGVRKSIRLPCTCCTDSTNFAIKIVELHLGVSNSGIILWP